MAQSSLFQPEVGNLPRQPTEDEEPFASRYVLEKTCESCSAMGESGGGCQID